MQQLTHEIGRQRQRDLLRAVAPHVERSARRAPREVMIRVASSADPALSLLAALEGRPVGNGDWLYAEADGGAAAALRLDDGAVLANPFAHTAELRRMLELWARELTGRRRRRWLPAF